MLPVNESVFAPGMACICEGIVELVEEECKRKDSANSVFHHSAILNILLPVVMMHFMLRTGQDQNRFDCHAQLVPLLWLTQKLAYQNVIAKDFREKVKMSQAALDLVLGHPDGQTGTPKGNPGRRKALDGLQETHGVGLAI